MPTKDESQNVENLETNNLEELEAEGLKGFTEELWNLEKEVASSDLPIEKLSSEELQQTREEIQKLKEEADIMKENAKFISETVYSYASDITSNALYNITHDIGRHKKWPEYVEFAEAVKNQDNKKAREIILAMLPKMDGYVNKYQGKGNKVNFNSIADGLNSITDESELWQAIMSLNNLFTRVPSVKWLKRHEYRFVRYEWTNEIERSIWNLLEQRTKEIKNNIDKSDLPDSLKVSYKNMIDTAEKYRQDNPKWYEATKKKAPTLKNWIWINLWGTIDIEKEMVQPEYYKELKLDFDKLEFQGKDEVEKRALEIVVNNRALLWTLLSNKKIDVTNPELEIKIISNENGKVEFICGWETITLEARFSLWYFSQCVNHMIMMDKFSVKIWKSKKESKNQENTVKDQEKPVKDIWWKDNPNSRGKDGESLKDISDEIMRWIRDDMNRKEQERQGEWLEKWKERDDERRARKEEERKRWEEEERQRKAEEERKRKAEEERKRKEQEKKRQEQERQRKEQERKRQEREERKKKEQEKESRESQETLNRIGICKCKISDYYTWLWKHLVITSYNQLRQYVIDQKTLNKYNDAYFRKWWSLTILADCSLTVKENGKKSTYRDSRAKFKEEHSVYTFGHKIIWARKVWNTVNIDYQFNNWKEHEYKWINQQNGWDCLYVETKPGEKVNFVWHK